MVTRVAEFCCGFMFDLSNKFVVLIKRRESRKYKPGCWNGVGGKVEDGETPLQAMRREFKEEAGLDIKDWRKFCELRAKDPGFPNGFGSIHMFYTEQDYNTLLKTTSCTDETVRVISIESLRDIPRMPNLNWLVAMAKSQSVSEGVVYNIESMYKQ